MFSILSIVGFEGSILVSLLVGVFIIFYNRKLVGFFNSTALAIAYLMLFDNDKIFAYTSLKLRVWYVLVIILIFYHVLKSVNNAKKTKLSIELCLIIFLFILVCCWFIVDTYNGKLSIIKYMLFSVGSIYVLLKSFKSISLKVGTERLLDYFISLVAFVATWGIVQFVMNILGHGSPYMFDFYNIRPSAFFSETTWYAEYSFFGLIFLSCKSVVYNNYKYNFLFVLIVISLVLSATRNAYLSFVVFGGGMMFLNLLRGKIYIPKFRYIIICLGILVGVLSIFQDQINFICNKFMNLDNSSQGRLYAINTSWNSFLESPIWGYGFSFDQTKDSIGISGTSIGAKSFNLFLMLLHIFGLSGFIPFLLLLLAFFTKNAYKYRAGNQFSRYAFLFLSIFLSMSMFAPLHQYPFGMYIVAVALFFSSKIKYDEDCVRNSVT